MTRRAPDGTAKRIHGLWSVALAALLYAACDSTDDVTSTTPSLAVGRSALSVHTAPGDTTTRPIRLSLRASDAAALYALAGLQTTVTYGAGDIWTLTVAPDTLSDGALALVTDVAVPPQTAGVHSATVTVSGGEYNPAEYAVDVNVHPFLIRLVLPPIPGHEEDVDAITQASDVLPQLGFIVLPPTDGTDSLKDIRIRTTDIDTTLYHSTDGSFLPAFYGRTFPVTHWYVKDTATAGICTTYAYAETYGGRQSMDMVVVRVLNKDEH
ncbi:MAG: hypothetical protein GF331_24615 [Chitinivibrionales bacterium]|nr:hypothetical protein [Chitinivibrionales bacterium]